MAFLNTPAVQPSEYSIELMAPGRSTFRNIVDGRDRIFSRGVAYWQGFFEWGPYSKQDDDITLGALQSFVQAASMGDHTFDISIPGLNQGDRFNDQVTIVSFTSAGSLAQVQLSVAQDAASNIGLRAGDYIEMDNRLYRCFQNQAVNTIFIMPGYITASAGDAIEYTNPQVRARGNGEVSAVTKGPDFVESLSLGWVQTDG